MINELEHDPNLGVKSVPKTEPADTFKTLIAFIAVLAAHILVVGGYVAYVCRSDSSPDMASTASPSARHDDASASPEAGGNLARGASNGSATASASSAGEPSSPAGNGSPASTDEAASNPSPASLSPAAAPAASPETTAAPATAAENNPASGGEAAATAPNEAGSASATDSASSPPVEAAGGSGNTLSTSSRESLFVTYTVRHGDTLASVAHRHHLTLARLKALNHLTSKYLRAGQELKLPSSVTPSSRQLKGEIAGTETSSGLSFRVRTYVVKSGDSLHKIAHHFKTTTARLLAFNNLPSNICLKPGMKIKIPLKSSVTNSTPQTSPVPVSNPASSPVAASQSLANFTQP